MNEVEWSIIIPVYRNAQSLNEWVERFQNAVPTESYECIFVNDGSDDASEEILSALVLAHYPKIRLINHKKNAGAFEALKTGMYAALGKYVSSCSADLQDPPEVLVELFSHLKAGKHETVLAYRREREEGWIKQLLASTFHWGVRVLIGCNLPRGGFDLIILKRTSVLAILPYIPKEVHALYAFIEQEKTFETLPYTRKKRPYGRSQWTFKKKVRLFLFTLQYFLYGRIGVQRTLAERSIASKEAIEIVFK